MLHYPNLASSLAPLKMNGVKENYNVANAPINLTGFKKTRMKCRLIAVVTGFNTLLALAGVAIGVIVYGQFYNLDNQSSASVRDVSSSDVFQLQNSIVTLQAHLNLLFRDIQGIKSTKCDALLEFMASWKYYWTARYS